MSHVSSRWSQGPRLKLQVADFKSQVTSLKGEDANNRPWAITAFRPRFAMLDFTIFNVLHLCYAPLRYAPRYSLLLISSINCPT
jgi:hypothetical protein